MPKLKCDVYHCIFQQEEYCTRSNIIVIGPDALNEEQTSCGSFKKQDRIDRENIYSTEFAEFGTINRNLSVNCESVNCKYNRHKLCTAEGIKITGEKAKHKKETLCATYEDR